MGVPYGTRDRSVQKDLKKRIWDVMAAFWTLGSTFGKIHKVVLNCLNLFSFMNLHFKNLELIYNFSSCEEN